MDAKPTGKEVVFSFVKALNDGDFAAARRYVGKDISFVGSLAGVRAPRYDLTASGATTFCCGWYQLQGGKLTSLRVVFDPRPLLERFARK